MVKMKRLSQAVCTYLVLVFSVRIMELSLCCTLACGSIHMFDENAQLVRWS